MPLESIFDEEVRSLVAAMLSVIFELHHFYKLVAFWICRSLQIAVNSKHMLESCLLISCAGKLQ